MLAATTAKASAAKPSKPAPVPTDADVRAERMAAARAVTGRLLRATWRHLLPLYLAATGAGTALVATYAGLPARAGALVGVLAAVVAWFLPASGRPVRLYRATAVAALSVWGVAVVAVGPAAVARHGLTVWASLAWGALLAGWPWWWSLRTRVSAVEELTAEACDEWVRRWETDVVGNGVLAGTSLSNVRRPRPGVVEADLRVPPGSNVKEVVGKAPAVETCLPDADEGSVGLARTGKAGRLRLVVVERSYIATPTVWKGPSQRDGSCWPAMFADGTLGQWVFLRRRFGSLNGLVVGSTGSGKTITVAILVGEACDAGYMTVVGDPQNGQSLPAWRHAVSEYHATPEGTEAMLLRLEAEVSVRSELLGNAGVSVYDADDPRVKKLGIRPLFAFVDECQLVLLAENKRLITAVENIAATDRKTGVGLVVATQIPQIRSLGGSIRLRDALVAGNCMIMRLSNRGSGTTVLPNDFVGDPFAIPLMVNGEITAGMGYLRAGEQGGLLARAFMIDEDKAAAKVRRVPMRWLAPPVDPKKPAGKPAAPRTGGSGRSGPALAALSSAGTSAAPAASAASVADWVLAVLKAGPTTSAEMLARRDCPVKKSHLHAVLGTLATDGVIIQSGGRGAPFRKA